MSEIVADTAQIPELEDQLDALDRHGFLLVRNALSEDVVLAWRECLVRKYERREWDISNEVGNVAFDHLLEQEPELAQPMVAHPSVAPYLQAMLGRLSMSIGTVCHTSPRLIRWAIFCAKSLKSRRASFAAAAWLPMAPSAVVR